MARVWIGCVLLVANVASAAFNFVYGKVGIAIGLKSLSVNYQTHNSKRLPAPTLSRQR